MSRPEADLAAVCRGIGKLVVVEISLDRTHDNPQLIFESLNSTGMDLTQADLIRNFVLMDLEAEKQAEIYNKYWFPMEQSFGNKYGSYFDYFMRDYLTVKSRAGAIPNVGKVYEKFKGHRQEQTSQTISEVVGDIHRYSTYYTRLAFERDPDAEVNRVMHDINTLEVDVAFPFFLELYDDYADERLTRADFVAVLRLVESYVFRRAICDIPTNSLNKTFATLTRDPKFDKSHYLESVKALLLLKESYRRFPPDDEFFRMFTTRNIYDLSKRRSYLFGKLETYQHKEPISFKDFTIEHVMPQNEHLSPEWQAMLGADWQRVRPIYLHTIGNLTLTRYNSELSDKPFLEKREMKGGFKDSHLRLNADLAELTEWNETEIQKRAQRLANIAMQVWPAPALPSAILAKYGKPAASAPSVVAPSFQADLDVFEEDSDMVEYSPNAVSAMEAI
jgi:hypothetical protein